MVTSSLERYIVKALKRNSLTVRGTLQRIMSPQSAVFRRRQLIRASTCPPARFSFGSNPLCQVTRAKASAIAWGTCASASTTFARISCAARISCSTATAAARRTSAFACAMSLLASACSVWSLAPMFSPTSRPQYRSREFQTRYCYRALCQDGFGNAIRIFQHFLVGVG